MKKTCWIAVLCLSINVSVLSQTIDFDEETTGPWSDESVTTIVAPKVANGSVQADASVSSAEYGGFEGISVVPIETGWVLNFAQTREWVDADDSSFTFYTAYDDDFLYVGVEVKDDVVRSNDPNGEFWKDDAVEFIIGPEPDIYFDIDAGQPATNENGGGHSYINFEGRHSGWDDAANTRNASTIFASGVDWEFGEDKEVFGFGQETAGGWTVEFRYHKTVLEVPGTGVLLAPGNQWKFNIAIDDDDGGDLAIQYWWANHPIAKGFTPDSEFFDLLTEEEIADRAFLDPEHEAAFWEIGLNQPLSYPQAGNLILGDAPASVASWSLY